MRIFEWILDVPVLLLALVFLLSGTVTAFMHFEPEDGVILTRH
ncbi:hypothetical protein [Rhodococcus sp. 27YEA15]